MGNETLSGWGMDRDAKWTLTVGSLKDCDHAEAREALEALRERHPEYLLTVWSEMLRAQGGKGGEAFSALPAHLFLEAVGNPPPMLIEGLLPDKSLFLLSGKPKAGKSFLALDMAFAVRRGEPVFGTHAVHHPGPVVYLGMEDGEYEIANRLMARGVRRDGSDGADIEICARRFNLSEPERMAALRAYLEPLQPSLLIVDTAAEALGIKDWLNRSEIVEKVGLLRDLARQVCAVLLVSHNRKSDGDSGDEIAGSNAFTGAVDGWISAYKVECLPNGNRRLYLRTEGRGGVRGELTVEMDTKTLHFSCLTPEEAAQGEHSAKQAAKDEMAEKIARAITDYGGKATVKQMCDFWECPYNTMNRHVQRLVASGYLIETSERFTPMGGGPSAALYRVG